MSSDEIDDSFSDSNFSVCAIYYTTHINYFFMLSIFFSNYRNLFVHLDPTFSIRRAARRHMQVARDLLKLIRKAIVLLQTRKMTMMMMNLTPSEVKGKGGAML
jgi:hypothetical protein